MNNMDLINRTTQIMVAKMEQISVPVCMKCRNGINGIPNCRVSECDLPIELIGKEGRIGIVIANLIDDKWNFQVINKTYDVYYFFGFDKDWNEILGMWKMPRQAVLEHLEELEFFKE